MFVQVAEVDVFAWGAIVHALYPNGDQSHQAETKQENQRLHIPWRPEIASCNRFHIRHLVANTHHSITYQVSACHQGKRKRSSNTPRHERWTSMADGRWQSRTRTRSKKGSIAGARVSMQIYAYQNLEIQRRDIPCTASGTLAHAYLV